MNDNINLVIPLDYPDPDVIRVGETYYMASTTMHFCPCCEILRSYDLVHWEHASYVSSALDGTPAQRLESGNIFGKGMWAASLRYKSGKFFVAFVCNDTHKTYLYTASDVCGEWEKSEIKGFYHDCSLFFDDDGRNFIVYGNKEIWLTELCEDLSAPKEGGLHRRIAFDEGNDILGYEGSHFYKINGRYYLFVIHSRKGRWFRCEACFSSDSLEGEFTGGDVFEDDMGYCGQGIAQGGIVDTPDGKWYAMLFQDRGAAGRMPVLIPVTWNGDIPVFGNNGKAPERFETPSPRSGYEYSPLVSSDDFRSVALKPCWQFSHEPDPALYSCGGGIFRIMTGKICDSVMSAVNTLTERMTFPRCEVKVTLDASGMKDGDCAGLCAYQGCYAWIGVCVRDGKNYIVTRRMSIENIISEDSVPAKGNKVTLGMTADFENMRDEAVLYYFENGEKKQLGGAHKLYFRLDHFTGCRAALFMYSEKTPGGHADFSDFSINM